MSNIWTSKIIKLRKSHSYFNDYDIGKMINELVRKERMKRGKRNHILENRKKETKEKEATTYPVNNRKWNKRE